MRAQDDAYVCPCGARERSGTNRRGRLVWVSRIEKFGVAIRGWFLGLVGGIGAAVLVAWLWDRWETHRQGVGIGLGVLLIVFWGIVLGIFVIGPAVAVASVRRAGVTSTGDGGPRRRPALVIALTLAASLLVAAGGVGVCLANDWAPCRGIPPHETIGNGSFQYVLPSPDGSRFVWVAGYLDDTRMGLLDPNVLAFETPSFDLQHETTLLEAAWMPDSRRLLIAFRTGDGDAIGIVSSDTGLMGSSHPLPFRVADRSGITVSPDGSSALILADSRDSFGKRLYRVDLASGTSDLAASFLYGASSPLYLDADTAVVIELDVAHSGLTLVDLRTNAVRRLTADDVSVYALAGADAQGGLVFTGFRVSPDHNITTEDQDDPFVGELDVADGQIHELFEPGVTGAMRMVGAGTEAVALAQTCSGECGGGEQVWKLDLSRYLGSGAG
jgi:hypothetical protein